MKRITVKDLRIHMFERPFRKLNMGDRKWVEKACEEDAGIGMHVHFLSMLQSQEMFAFDIFRRKWGCVLKCPWADNGKLFVQYPIGSSINRKKAVKEIEKLYSGGYKEFVFFAASDENLEELRELYGDAIINIEDKREYQDYILDAKEQITLEGPQFSSRRNKIRRFQKLNNWSYEDITRDNMDECLEISSQWYDNHERTQETMGEELALRQAFSLYDAFHFQGGILRVDGKAVAFHIGVPFNKEIYMCEFLKSRREYRDAPIVLLHEFMKRNCEGYRYINYSEDLGIEGLRLFKMNLHPKFMVPCYYVTIKMGD